MKSSKVTDKSKKSGKVMDKSKKSTSGKVKDSKGTKKQNGNDNVLCNIWDCEMYVDCAGIIAICKICFRKEKDWRRHISIW